MTAREIGRHGRRRGITSVQDVAGAPKYDPDIERRQKHYENVYGHYGIPPFWLDVGPTDNPHAHRYPGT